MQSRNLTRRALLTTVAAGLGTMAATGMANAANDALVGLEDAPPDIDKSFMVKRNISSFTVKDWPPYFDNLRKGAVLVDISSRALHFWSEDEEIYRLYPTSVPVSPELTRLGRTHIVGKKEGPDWRPTPNMLERNPEWPAYVPPGPDNPMGTHALYLSWKYYRIHGTHDTRKIGRESSNGCIGLYNEHVAELYELSKIGTQVLII